MKDFIKISFLGMLTVLLVSCEPLDEVDESDPIVIPKVIMISNPQTFDREAVEIDPVTIVQRNISSNLLTLQVSYSGGCEDHSFRLYSTEPVYFGIPGQCDVYLSHNGHGDSCEALIDEFLQFDLSPIGEDAKLKVYPFESESPLYPLMNYIFHD